MDSPQEELRRRLGELGFDEVRFARTADLPPSGSCVRAWGRPACRYGVDGTHGRKSVSIRRRCCRACALGDNARCKLLERREVGGHPGRRTGQAPIWARYALHEDYHDTIKPALRDGRPGNRATFRRELSSAGDYRYYVDTGPVLERGWAAQAGLGFIGKNAMLISRRHGNWLFLAAILTRVEFLADEPIRKKFRDHASGKESGVGLLCGKCTRCLDACPTDAFPRPGVVDARRCISYQTIENRGIIPRELRGAIGFHLYGCDVCLEVCPWNRFARAGRQLLLAARGDIAGLSLREILDLTPARFTEVFRRTAIKRLKLAGLLRNAVRGRGQFRRPRTLEPLLRLARPRVADRCGPTRWALRRLGRRTPRCPVRLEKIRLAETKMRPCWRNLEHGG